MVELNKKLEFIGFILKYDFVKNRYLKEFFEELYENSELLENIVFSIKRPVINYKYQLFVDMKKGMFIFENEDMKLNELNSLDKILDVIKNIKSGLFCICIMDDQQRVKTKLEPICQSSDLIKNLVNDAFLDYLLIDGKKKFISDKIDEALKNNNKEEFNNLVKQYNELIYKE